MGKHVVSVSGGKDSTAMYLLAMERLQGDFLPVFADTGNEHEITLEYVSRLAERTGGPEVQVVKADFRQRLSARRETYSPEQIAALDAAGDDPAPYLALCLYKGIFPSNIRRFCTVELKVMPIYRYCEGPLLDAGHTVVSWQGIRASESDARALLLEKEPNRNDSRITEYRPILQWSVQEVFAMHKRHGLPPNPLYKMGFSRVGCMPCIMGRKKDISCMIRRFPEHVARIRIWEKLVQQVSKTGRVTFFPDTKVPGENPMRGSVDSVIAWARCEVPGQGKLLNYEPEAPACQSEYGLCE
jgi:3'-phosphoadenosine 5'-phosphosulfate sulfotransferase (PAPS reductase)/FAD synthetase